MAAKKKTSSGSGPKSKRTVKNKMEKVMHEYKHHDLESGRSGKKVKNRKQAIAIGLSEAGASRKQNPAPTKRKGARAEQKAPKHGAAAQGKGGRAGREEPTRAELYAEARRREMSGCSRMSKAELQRALRSR